MLLKTRRLLNIALLAGIFEWYEFSIYALLAARYGEIFFNSTDPISTALSAYFVLMITYLARPIGSLFFAYFGDRVGRGSALKLSLILMAAPTVLIGLLPTYKQAGLYSSIALCLLRLVQGFAVGGELTNSAVYVFESAPSKQKAFLCSLVSASIEIGCICGSIAMTGLVWFFDRQEILEWAWRIPFLFGLPLTLWIWKIRSLIQEEPIQQQTTRDYNLPQLTLRESFIKTRNSLFKVFFLGAFGTTLTYTFSVWLPFYLSVFLEVSDRIAYSLNTVTRTSEALFLILSGILARYINYLSIYKGFFIAILLLIFPMVYGLSLGVFSILLGIHILFALLHGGMDGQSIMLVGQLMPKEVRSLGLSVNFTLASTLVGGITPMLLTYFTHKTGNLLFPAFYILLFGLLGLPILLRLKPTESKSLSSQ
jgi:MFS transporter, MHS family, proline/betaine transporter